MAYLHRFALVFAVSSLFAVVVLSPSPTRAEMWCADPLWVHEWGVQVFGRTGAARSTVGPSLPGYFHRRAPSGAGAVSAAPVRHMPVDGGERALPVVHFYAPETFQPVPVGFEVGFTHGEATRWFPQVDTRRAAGDANGAAARAARERLLSARVARRDAQARAPLPGDPTRQLAWDRLTLSPNAVQPARATSHAWVRAARGFDRALWVNARHETERFVFYEGRTTETPALRVERGPTWSASRPHYRLVNAGSHPVHDVFVVHRDAGRLYVFVAPQIPPRRSAGFLLTEHEVPRGQQTARTREALRARLLDTQQPAPPRRYSWGQGQCVMQRDPAQPVESARGHRLYAHEVDLILDTWGPRFFEASGTTIVYREDTSYVDREMPVSVYTDMYHFVQLSRLSLGLMENVQLP